MSEWNRQGTTIGHLRVRCDGPQEMDRTTLRLRVERLLGRVDLEPPGLASGAMLIVRKVLAAPRIPARGTPTMTTSNHPDRIMVGVDWNEGLRQQMSALYAAAARPVLGPVSPNASSVLFNDSGEMLTCLTRDLLSEQAWSHWYWQQVLRNIPRVTHAALTALWCENASFVPTVLAALRPAEAYAAIAQLELLEVRQVIYALYESFELPTAIVAALASDNRGQREAHQEVSPGAFSLQELPDTLPSETITPRADTPPGESTTPRVDTPSRATTTTSGASTTPPLRATTRVAPTMITPPWERWLAGGESLLPTVRVEARYLLGVSTALYHAPSFARSACFAVQASAWLQAVRSEQERAWDAPRQAAGDDLVEPHLARSTRRPHDIPERPHASTGQPQEFPSSIPERPHASLGRPQGSPPHVPATPAPTMTTKPPGEQASLEAQEYEEQPPDRAPQAPPASVSQALPVSREFVFGVSKALPTDGVSTALGGVLYLINLLLWLKLPLSWDEPPRVPAWGTLTMTTDNHQDGVMEEVPLADTLGGPDTPGEVFAEHMGGWAMVEALARGLLGDTHERYVADPLWVALALLDRRDVGEPIAACGIWVGGERAFRLPVAWLQRFGSSEWLAVVRGERLLLVDEPGAYLIVDVPLGGRSFMEAAHVEVEAYVAQGLSITWRLGGLVPLPALHASLAAYVGEDARWWLERVLGFVRYVLARALREASADPERLASLLLCKYGRLLVSRTHVDLHMSMEEISLPIRLAGLDRDPGWVPDLARIVYFHFD